MTNQRVTIVGARGLVGSAFARLLANRGVETRLVTRENYADFADQESDVVIDAAGNSVKYLADSQPCREFDASVGHRVRTLRDFPARLHLHVSSVDVYADLSSPAMTREELPADPAGCSNYGYHKRLAEDCVRRYARSWLIVRLAGMVGPGLRKNPVFDILTGRPLRIHPDSQYQFLHTDDVARLVWSMVEDGLDGRVINVCGAGLISPQRISEIAGRPMDLSAIGAATPRIVDVNIDRLRSRGPVPSTVETIEQFVASADGRALQRPASS